MLTVIDTFAGIGGFSYGLEKTNFFKTIALVEIDDYAQRVLQKNFPGVPIYGDIKRFTAEAAAADGLVRRPDVITGGFPCTDISLAGNQAGIEGEESGLWQELRRVIGDFRPRYAVMENVSALLSGDRGRWFGRVLGDLASLGYIVEWHCIPASHIGAPHRRDRVWIIASDAHSSKVWLEQRWRSPGACPPVAADDGSAEPVADAYPGGRAPGGGVECSPPRPGSQYWNDPQRRGGVLPHTFSERLEGIRAGWTEAGAADGPGDGGDTGWWAVEPDVGRVANGVSNRVDRLRCLGNAIVPTIAQLIGYAIAEREGLL